MADQYKYPSSAAYGNVFVNVVHSPSTFTMRKQLYRWNRREIIQFHKQRPSEELLDDQKIETEEIMSSLSTK